MNQLDIIIKHKQNEIALRREQLPLDQLIKMPQFDLKVMSLSDALRNGSGVIAEFKRASPSAGLIQDRAIEEVVQFYQKHQVSAFSVLTDHEFFKGKIEDIQAAKTATKGVVLRKEFIIDEYQLFEAKAFGADAILLIAEALDEYHAKHLATIAHSIGLEVLMEFHSEKELDKLSEAVDVVGINNRNLKTLKTDLETSRRLFKFLPYEKVKITESGIRTLEDLESLYSFGYQGCLIGESVLKDPDLLPALTAAAINHKIVNHEA